MPLHINNPKYSKERADSKPLSLEEQKYAVWLIKEGFATTGEENTKLVQRLLYHYENLQALSDFIGGWEGANRLVKDKD